MNNSFTLTNYKKGDVIPGMLPMKAGEDMLVASCYGISADIFDMGSFYQCPSVASDNPGSGKFGDFLDVLKHKLDKPLYFTSIINAGIIPHLVKHGIGIIEENKIVLEPRATEAPRQIEKERL